MNFFYSIGLYITMLQKMFHKPTKWKVMKELILKDTEDTVLNSLGIISFVSFFIGGVITIQLALSTTGSLMPDNTVGYATRETIILEFAPTIIGSLSPLKTAPNHTLAFFFSVMSPITEALGATQKSALSRFIFLSPSE